MAQTKSKRTAVATNALFALELFGGQWHRDGHLLFPWQDPILANTFIVYTLKKATYGDMIFSRHVVTLVKGEYTCNCEAFKYRRNRDDFFDKHIKAVVEAKTLPPEPEHLYKEWQKYNEPIT